MKIAILATNFAGNKGAAAMLKSLIKNLDNNHKNISYNLMSVYPGEDREQNPFEHVKVVSCKPQEIIFIAFPLAILFYIFKWFWPIRKVLLGYKILKGFIESDIVIDAAGITFVDSRGFIMNTYNFICMATPMLLGRKIIKYSQALGPFNTTWNRLLAKIILPKISRICARGLITKKYLDELGLDNVELCADGAFSLPDDPGAERKIKNIINGDKFYSGNIVSVSISSVVDKLCGLKGIDYKGVISEFIDYLMNEKGYNVLIIANSARKGTKKTHNNDLTVCQEVYERVKDKDCCRWYDDIFTPEEIREFIGLSKLMVASRFHAMIAALHQKVPVLLVGWSHKYKEVLDMFLLGGNAIDYRELSAEKLKDAFSSFEAKSGDIRKQIEKKLPEVKVSSNKNIKVIMDVMAHMTPANKYTALDYSNPEKYMGDYHSCYMGYSLDEEIRNGAASGGIVSSLLIYMLESGKIDGALVSRQVMDNGKISAETFIATSREEIMDCRTSIYMDFPMQRSYMKILDFNGKVAVVGIPCQLEDLKIYEKKYPGIKDKIEVKMSLFCSGSESKRLIERILVKNKIEIAKVKKIFFRKGHWRGKTHIIMKDGSEKVLSYLHNICTYRNLFFYSRPKCYSCIDQFGYNADICSGDLWLKEMKDNPLKHTAIFTRKKEYSKLLENAAEKKFISLVPIEAKKIVKSQKRPLIYKFNSAGARKKVGKLFGLKYRGNISERPKWNHYLVSILIAVNIKVAESKIVFLVPQKLMFLYMGFVRFLLSF